jgi:hypothetical protein
VQILVWQQVLSTFFVVQDYFQSWLHRVSWKDRLFLQAKYIFQMFVVFLQIKTFYFTLSSALPFPASASGGLFLLAINVS